MNPGRGLALLLRSGMQRWMVVWAHRPESAPAKLPDRPDHAETIPLEIQHEVVTILAAMILYGRQEATA